MNSKHDNIDESFIEELSIFMNISKEDLITKINMFIDRYYPGDNQVHSYIGVENYDLKNGQHLSNEARFIYANCLVEKFNNMNLDFKQRIDFYKQYLDNAKDMTFQDVLEQFNVDLTNSHSFSEEFINEFNTLSTDTAFQRTI